MTKSSFRVFLAILSTMLISFSAQAATVIAEKILYSDVVTEDDIGILLYTSGNAYETRRDHQTHQLLSRKFFARLSQARMARIAQLVQTIKGPLSSNPIPNCDEGVNEWNLRRHGQKFIFARQGGCQLLIAEQQNAHVLKGILDDLFNLARFQPVETQ